MYEENEEVPLWLALDGDDEERRWCMGCAISTVNSHYLGSSD
jgi:hypothetical protein